MLLIITGLSGAGKTTALHALEDLGIFCTDNLPVEMLSAWAEQIRARGGKGAVCIDFRSSSDPQSLHAALSTTLSEAEQCHLLFVEANEAVLLRRYSALKRKHPFAPERVLPDAISAEIKAFEPLRELAGLVVDSTDLNPYQLAEMVESFWQQHDQIQPMEPTCSLISFSYRHGLPQNADLVIDVRFLPNPHYQPELRPLTGRDEAIRTFFDNHPEVAEAQEHLQAWLAFVWDQLKRERKQYLTVAIGCSGGRHRSVFMVEQLAAWMQTQGLASPMITHRELES